MGWFVPALIAGASFAGGMLGNRKQTEQQRFNSNEAFDKTTHTGIDTYAMPEYTEQMQTVLNNLLGVLGKRMDSSTDLTGYTTQGLTNINKSSELKRRAMESILASRGLSYSPAAAAPLGRIQSDRIGEQINFLNGIPLLQRQLQGEDIDRFTKFFSSLPVGEHRTGSTVSYEGGHSTKEGYNEGTTPGNMWGGGLGNLASTMAYLYGNGAFGGPQKKTIPWP